MKNQLVQWITTLKESDGKQVSGTLDKLRAELERVYSVKISKSALSVNLAKMNIRLSELFPRISRQTRENRLNKKTLNYLKVKAERIQT
jgi:hypothetical protein